MQKFAPYTSADIPNLVVGQEVVMEFRDTASIAGGRAYAPCTVVALAGQNVTTTYPFRIAGVGRLVEAGPVDDFAPGYQSQLQGSFYNTIGFIQGAAHKDTGSDN